jgi:predicted ATPase/signal transduction histidine kinase
VTDIGEYGVRELVLANEGYVLYRARHEREGDVLLKVARDGASPEELSALSLDFLTAGRCDIREIPRGIRIATTEAGATFQVRQSVPGRPLSVWLDGHLPRPSLGEAVQMAIAILSALERLHARGYVHCNISPRNLLYDLEGRSVYFADCSWTRGGGMASRPGPHPETPYNAPEQLLNDPQAVDGRADLYAVGVILNQLVTGELPSDEGASSKAAGLPPALIAVIDRLVAADRDRRPETSTAAKRDLVACLADLPGQRQAAADAGHEEAGRVVRFPEEPCGRLEVRAALAECLADARAGKATLALLTGEGGSGKSTLLQELRRTARASGALVFGGGWGLFDRNIPFRGLTPICEQLVEWMSTLDQSRRAERVAMLREALGEGCGVVTEAFPVLEALLGIHPRPAEVGTLERQNRLMFCLTVLLGAIGGPEAPLVLLLEDLHWADDASLLMLERLPGQAAPRHLLTLATVRIGVDGDGADPAFVPALVAACEERGQTVRTLAVAPFQRADAAWYLSTALGVPAEQTNTLADVLAEVSAGNPLAFRELLAEAAAQKLLAFDQDKRAWAWRAEAIRQSCVPEDVARIFASRISSMPPAGLQALRVASCLGPRFDLGALALLLGTTVDEAGAAVEACRAAGFVVADGPQAPVPVPRAAAQQTFQFRHERIQSAAYAGLAAAEQDRLHAAHGAALLESYRQGHSADNLFEALSHLNRSHTLRAGGADLELAKLNLQAARLAKQSTAFGAAARYLEHVAAQLPAVVWQSDPELAFEFGLLRAECAYLAQQTSLAEETYADLLGRSHDPERRIRVLLARGQMLTNRGRFKESISDAIACLELLGLKLPARPSRGQVLFPMLRMLTLHRRLPAADRPVEIVELDPTSSRIMSCLAELWGPAFWVDENLTGLVVFAMVRLSLMRGNTPASSIGYASYGAFLAMALKKHQLGKQVCHLGVAVAEKAASPLYVGRARFMYEGFFGAYDRPLREAPAIFRQIAATCLRGGDYAYAGAAANMFLYYLPLLGTPLADFSVQAREIVSAARQTDQSRTLLTVEILQRWIAILEGREEPAAPRFADVLTAGGQRNSENERGLYHMFEISLLYFLEDFDAADPHIACLPGNKLLVGYFAAYYPFFSALVLAKQAQQATAPKRWLAKFRRYRRLVEVEAARSPSNCRHKALLLAAVEAAALGKHERAKALFEDAIADAEREGFIQHAAIGAELLAEQHWRRGERVAAEQRFRDARRWYAQWGCVRKVAFVDRRLAQLAPDERTSSSGVAADAGDGWPRQAGPVLEAARALSRETDPARLAERLMSSILEHTGATRVVLLTPDGDKQLTVACERRPPIDDGAAAKTPASAELPHTVINYVDRLGRPLRLKASTDHELFGPDPYMKTHAGATLLCVPLVNMQQRLGVLFVEKQGPGRLRGTDQVTAEILAAQAAATLSNAREYAERLTALQNQIHPHFLFNALSGIAELTAQDPAAAERSLVGLAALYRNVLDSSRSRAIPLARELELIQLYLALEKLRFGQRLDYRLDVSGDARAVVIPPLVLQPIVENSVKHGITPKPGGGTVTVTASIGDSRVHIRVSDDGVGWGHGGEAGAGVGLSSVRRRLQLFFGSNFELDIRDKDGVTIDLFFPARTDAP